MLTASDTDVFDFVGTAIAKNELLTMHLTTLTQRMANLAMVSVSIYLMDRYIYAVCVEENYSSGHIDHPQ